MYVFIILMFLILFYIKNINSEKSLYKNKLFLLSLQFRMAQADSRALALGVLAGAAGISLVIVCFRKIGAGGGRVLHLSSNADHTAGSLGLHTGQAEVLDRLGALIHCVSELKEEVKALKDALPHLQDNVRDQLRGRSGDNIAARRASPLHRTPTRRKRAGVSARSEGQSSEEAESEGGWVYWDAKLAAHSVFFFLFIEILLLMFI